MKRVEEACHRACLLDTILHFPKKFDTIVGEKGVILSGGQKQRVSLARSLLRDTPFLLLDDPISQVDSETAGKIMREILSLKGRKTIIIVSHNLWAIEKADMIFTMEKGKIMEKGDHHTLSQKTGYYRKIVHLQGR